MPVGRMPVGNLPDLEESQYNALNAGIDLFQCVWPGRIKYDKSVSGFFDCKVEDVTDNERGRQRYSRKWLTGPDAAIWFERSKLKKEIGIAWIPDDAFWHNRIVFMDNQHLKAMIAQLRQHDGNILSGADVLLELDCLEKELKTLTPIYKLIVNGRENDYFFSEKEAKDTMKIVKFKPGVNRETGLPTMVEIRGKKFEIKKDFRLSYKKEIEELKRRQLKMQRKFGWTECDEFMKEIKPKVIKRAEEIRAEGMSGEIPTQVGISPQQLVAALAELNSEDLEKVTAKLLGKKRKGKEPIAAN